MLNGPISPLTNDRILPANTPMKRISAAWFSAGVLEGLSTLRQGGVRPRWVVLDDGWQSTTNDDALNTEQWDERLVKFEANKRFR